MVARPGVHHRRRQPQAHPAHRDHAAAHLVRRLVAARERAGRSGCCSRCPTAGAEPPAAAGGAPAAGWPRSCGDAHDARRAAVRRGRRRRIPGPTPDRRQRLADRPSRSRPRSRRSPSAPAGGRSSTRSGCRGAPDNPAVIAIARRALRGPIADRDDRWLARSERDANGEARPRVPRRRRQPRRRLRVAPVRDRRASSAPTTPSSSASADRTRSAGCWTSSTPAADSPLGLQTTLDLRLQRAAVDGLGDDHGAVVMLDPATGDVLALASTPTYDAAGDRRTRTRPREAFDALRDDESDPLLPRATHGPLRAGLGVQDRHRRSPGLNTGPDLARDHVRGAAEGRGEGPARRRLPDPRRPPPADRRHGARPDRRDRGQLQHLVRARRARRPAATDLVDQAAELGFGAPIPFDLPTAVSR